MAIDKMNLHYSFTNPASAYDEEALTALELAGRQGAKINEIIEDQNNLRTETEEHMSEQDEILEYEKTVAIPTTIENVFQKKTNNGTFDGMINAYAGDIEKRLDNLLGKVVEGSTTMDAEVIDARMGYDGAEHGTLGGAIRSQFATAEFNARNPYFNRYNPLTYHANKYFSPVDNIEYSSDALWTTDYIQIRPNEKLNFVDGEGIMLQARFVCLYDHAKNPIRNDDGNHKYNYTQSGNVAFIRITINYDICDPSELVVWCATGFHRRPSYDGYIVEQLPDVTLLKNDLVHYNRLNPALFKNGFYPDFNNGFMNTNNAFSMSNYIVVGAGETICLYNRAMETQEIRMWASYDENGDFIAECSGEIQYFIANTTEKPIYVLIALRNTNLDLMCANLDAPRFLNYGETLPKANNATGDASVQVESMMGGKTYAQKYSALGSGVAVTLDGFPSHIKKNVFASFKAEFDTFSMLSIGRGGDGVYGGRWAEIDPTNVTIKSCLSVTTTGESFAHGLNITGYLSVVMSFDNDGVFNMTIFTLTGSYTVKLNEDYSSCGAFFAISGTTMKNVVYNATCKDFTCPLWMVGDSYFGASNQRIFGQLKNLGFNNYLLIGQPGLDSNRGYEELKAALNFGVPKFLIWYMGMNDGSQSEPYNTYLRAVADLCAKNGITLILNKVPTVPTINKEAIATVIDKSGYRYIDSMSAVQATSEGWSNGMLDGDGVHPTELGAKALAIQMVVDVPELIAYGKE